RCSRWWHGCCTAAGRSRPLVRWSRGRVESWAGAFRDAGVAPTDRIEVMKISKLVLSAALLVALPSLALAERGFQAEDLVSMDRFSSPVLSPDGRKLVFAKRTMDMEAGKASSSLWIEDLFARDAAPPVRLTPEGWSVNSPAFSHDGRSVYFLSGKNGSSQLYAIPASGGEPVQLTDFPVGIDGFVLSPDGGRIAFAARDRKSTRLNSSHVKISYAVFCLKKKKKEDRMRV